MPLSRVNRISLETDEGVHFGMMNGAVSIRILVTRDVLLNIGGLEEHDGLTAKFERYRREFETIASDKFDRGERGALKITPSDLRRYAEERVTRT